MNHLEATKTVVGTFCATSATTATLTLDTLGFRHASIDVIVAKSSTAGHTAASILNVLTLTQGDTTAAADSVYTVAVPAASVAVTNEPSVVRLDVDLRGKKRYVKVEATPAAALTTEIVARLSKAEIGPSNASGKGALSAYAG